MPDRRAHGLLLAAVLLPFLAAAQDASQDTSQGTGFTPGSPSTYVVRRGDTLWDLSERFLVDPWRWPEIWEANPQVENPHLIYPGDELALFYRDGEPRIRLRRRAGEEVPPRPAERRVGPRTVKLSPRARVLPREEAIPTIPIDAIHQFLSRPRVVGEEEYEAAPYIVSVGKDALIGRAGTKAFARRLPPDSGTRFSVYRRGKVYRDPSRGDEILGYEALHVADALLEERGDPSTVFLLRSNREVLVGDRLFPAREDQVDANFMPRAPDEDLTGEIIEVVDGVTQIGENQIVVLNLGTRDGIARGHVMTVWERGPVVQDPVSDISAPPERWWNPPVDESQRPRGVAGFPQALDDTVVATTDGVRDAVGQFLPGKEDPWVPGQARHELVKLPDQRAGIVMVFRPFERVSYALVMQATRVMHVRDRVTTP